MAMPPYFEWFRILAGQYPHIYKAACVYVGGTFSGRLGSLPSYRLEKAAYETLALAFIEG